MKDTKDEKKLKSLGSKLSRACFSLIANVNYGSSGGSKEKRKREKGKGEEKKNIFFTLKIYFFLLHDL